MIVLKILLSSLYVIAGMGALIDIFAEEKKNDKFLNVLNIFVYFLTVYFIW